MLIRARILPFIKFQLVLVYKLMLRSWSLRKGSQTHSCSIDQRFGLKHQGKKKSKNLVLFLKKRKA